MLLVVKGGDFGFIMCGLIVGGKVFDDVVFLFK